MRQRTESRLQVPCCILNSMHAADPIDAPPRDRTPDVSNRRSVHGLIRGSNERLVEGIASTAVGDRRRIRALRRWFTGYAAELRECVPVEPSQLHDLIERLEAVLLLWSEQPLHAVAADRALLLALAIRDRSMAVFAFEDVESHTNLVEYAELDRQVSKAFDVERIWFSLPWSVSGMDADSRKATLHAAPLRHKFAYRLTRRSYDRLVMRAFGGLASAWDMNVLSERIGELDGRSQESSDVDEIFGELACV